VVFIFVEVAPGPRSPAAMGSSGIYFRPSTNPLGRRYSHLIPWGPDSDPAPEVEPLAWPPAELSQALSKCHRKGRRNAAFWLLFGYPGAARHIRSSFLQAKKRFCWDMIRQRVGPGVSWERGGLASGSCAKSTIWGAIAAGMRLIARLNQVKDRMLRRGAAGITEDTCWILQLSGVGPAA
jgi:hypothetical protein